MKFDDFLKYAHENWNFYDDPRSALFMKMADTLISKAPQEWGPDDVEHILEMFENFDAEGMMHTYALHGYYQVISDILDNLSGSGKESNSNENISPPSVSATVIC